MKTQIYSPIPAKAKKGQAIICSYESGRGHNVVSYVPKNQADQELSDLRQVAQERRYYAIFCDGSQTDIE